jgi:16S rRNA (guanine966-N2)-methyltransferase
MTAVSNKTRCFYGEDSAMRITGGELGGRRFDAHASPHLRPALDQIRESVFNIIRDRTPDARVLDAFAGTGSLGLESLSRGAAYVVFVERHRPTAQRLEKLLAEWGLAERTRVVTADFLTAARYLAAPEPFDLIFLDPPYSHGLSTPALDRVVEFKLLAPRGLIILRHIKTEEPLIPAGLQRDDQRKYGDGRVDFLTEQKKDEHAETGGVPREF